MDVDEDGTLVAVERGCPDVEVKAVLTVDRVGLVERGKRRATLTRMDRLRSLGSEGKAIADAGPRLRADCRRKACGGGVGSIGDAFEDEDALIGEAANFAGASGGDGGGLGVKRAREQACGEEGGALEKVATVHWSYLFGSPMVHRSTSQSQDAPLGNDLCGEADFPVPMPQKWRERAGEAHPLLLVSS
jgi:hypothetical protein